MKIRKKNIFFFELLPFANFDIDNLMSQKTITARNFKLGQLIVDYLVIIKENGFFFRFIALCIFSSYCPLQILTSKTCNKDISKTIIARRLRFGQLIEDGE